MPSDVHRHRASTLHYRGMCMVQFWNAGVRRPCGDFSAPTDRRKGYRTRIVESETKSLAKSKMYFDSATVARLSAKRWATFLLSSTARLYSASVIHRLRYGFHFFVDGTLLPLLSKKSGLLPFACGTLGLLFAFPFSEFFFLYIVPYYFLSAIYWLL